MRVRMIFEGLNGSQVDRTYHGPWAWFKLLDASSVKKTSQPTRYLVTFAVRNERTSQNQDVHTIVYEVKTKSSNNPLKRDALTAFKMPESI